MSVIVGRLPTGMAALAIIMLVRGNGGSFALAGLLSSLHALSAAAVAPFAGRLVDRLGQPRVLVATSVAAAVGFAGLAATNVEAPAASAAFAVLAGGGTPPLEPCLRALWPALLRGVAPLEVAYAVEAAFQEVIFVVGPLLAVLTVELAGPVAGVAACGLVGLAGTVPFALSRPSRRWRGAPREADWLGPLRAPGMLVLVAVFFLMGCGWGGYGVGLPAYAEHVGVATLGGWLLATQAFGAALGGMLYGVREWPWPQHRRLPVALLLLSAGYFPLAAMLPPPVMVPLTLASGLMVPAINASVFVLSDRLAPAGTVTEAFAWTITGALLGIATGAAVGGFLVDTTGPRVALLAIAFCPLVSATLTTVTRRALTTAPRSLQSGEATA